ncbi:MAG TPA: SpoVR family protein [Defluviitaleaceae bacterium]|nr:SpoVR family protein [Defluviitaleaceae bacterium]
MTYSIDELKYWNEKIEKLAEEKGLDFYPQEFEIISYEDMLCYESYLGMPSHYPHWSFGKAYERLRTLYKYNITGLPYEMVINSNPSIAYLMKDNTLVLQILTMAHVYGHNDFFKNNRLFKEYTNADLAIEMFKNHGTRIREYIKNPGIGYEKVESVLDAVHSIRYQCGLKKRKKYENKKENETSKDSKDQKDVSDSLLQFLIDYGDCEEWEKDIINIVMEETRYFIPQIETKIINEGWACYWHYNILNDLELSYGSHIDFLKIHNSVIAPHQGRLNPYYLGFKIWKKIAKESKDLRKIFEVRALERDFSFIRRYLDFDICMEMNLIQLEEQDRFYLVTEVADDEGWKNIRNYLADTVGMGRLPKIVVDDVIKIDNVLCLKHIYDGRELDVTNTFETLKYIVRLWKGTVMLDTVVNKCPKRIICSKDFRISLENIES